jgi:hypothetical protein
MSDKVQASYTVFIHMDGSISTVSKEAGELVERQANTFDIYQTSRELTSDIESRILADRVAQAVVSQLQPKDNAADIKAKIIDALSDRGIDTSKD